MNIELIDFKKILPIWQEHLWPGRKSPIEPTSAISFLGGYDMSFMQAEPIFISVSSNEGGEIWGVSSGFKCSGTLFRLRGTWVAPTAIGQGVGTTLVDAIAKKAREADCRSLWTLARHTSVGFYNKLGFVVEKETDEFEFGPHFFMLKDLES